MKGIISGIKRMEIHDGDGLRTTVFFKGCPLKCIWCHNPESISFKKQIAYFENKCLHCGMCKGQKTLKTSEMCPGDALVAYGKEYEPSVLAEIVLKDRAFFNNGGGVTLSGGECLAQPEFAIEFSKLLKEQGISVYVDTCGYVKSEIFEKIIPYTDKFLYDIKAIDEEVHKNCTGYSNKIILDNFKLLSRNNCKVEVRYPLVMGYNDGECKKIAKFLSGYNNITKVKIIGYHSFAASRYKALDMLSTLPKTQTSYVDVENAVEIFKKFGLNAVS